MSSDRQRLRELVRQRSHNRCEWPECREAGRELAHLRSLGMGGSKRRDVPSNVAWFCRDHARISDGEHGSGGAAQYRLAHIVLLGAGVLDHMEPSYLAYERRRALASFLATRYGLVDDPPVC